jgi:hypothetical protein
LFSPTAQVAAQLPAQEASRTLLNRLEPQGRGLTRPSLSKGSLWHEGADQVYATSSRGKRGLAGGPAKRGRGSQPIKRTSESSDESLAAVWGVRAVRACPTPFEPWKPCGIASS